MNLQNFQNNAPHNIPVTMLSSHCMHQNFCKQQRNKICITTYSYSCTVLLTAILRLDSFSIPGDLATNTLKCQHWRTFTKVSSFQLIVINSKCLSLLYLFLCHAVDNAIYFVLCHFTGRKLRQRQVQYMAGCWLYTMLFQ